MATEHVLLNWNSYCKISLFVIKDSILNLQSELTILKNADIVYITHLHDHAICQCITVQLECAPI